MKHFEEFFVCPNCKKPIVRKEAVKYLENKYCGNCGIKIATVIEEAVANEEKKEDYIQHKATCSQKFDTEDEFIRLLKKYQESPSKIKY